MSDYDDYREYKRDYDKQYRIKNLEKIKENNKLRHTKEYNKKQYQERKEYQKEYKQSPVGKKSNRIGKWKLRGIIHDNYDELYERYLNTEFCELCNIKLTEDKTNTKTTRCLDHCHNTGEVRNVVCWLCNIKRR